MNRLDHLLVIVAEEASEIVKEASKCLRFGTNDEYQGSTNLEKLYIEFGQLIAVMEMLEKEDPTIKGFEIAKYNINNKKDKVEKYLEYSRNLGRLK